MTQKVFIQCTHCGGVIPAEVVMEPDYEEYRQIGTSPRVKPIPSEQGKTWNRLMGEYSCMNCVKGVDFLLLSEVHKDIDRVMSEIPRRLQELQERYETDIRSLSVLRLNIMSNLESVPELGSPDCQFEEMPEEYKRGLKFMYEHVLSMKTRHAIDDRLSALGKDITDF